MVIKITDFGIAKILDAQGVTSTGQVLGSPAHMAPEQIEGGDVDARTDVFALGVLMYECLVGHLPFEGKNPAQVLRRVLEGEYVPPDRERPSVGGRWTRIVAAALAREPADRTASARQLAEQIQAELSALGLPNGRLEIGAYFADPAGYIETHKGLLVPRLTARGEASRKAGDVWGAAADWNRALALAPADLTLLKRMASLNSNAGRRQIVRRAGAILAGSAVLGLGAFAIARNLKARDASQDSEHLAGAAALDAATHPPPEDSVTAEPEPRQVSAAPASVSRTPGPVDAVVRIPRIPATPNFVPGPAALAAPSFRDVKFDINPKGAILSIDGVLYKRWFLHEIPLTVGAHSVEVMPTDERCCLKAARTIQVDPPGPADGAQKIFLSMELKPSIVSLNASAPPGGHLRCPDIGLNVAAGTSISIKLRELETTVTCFFVAPERAQREGSVSLRAGETKSVPWPD